MTTVADMIVQALAEHGVRNIWGVVGDALNPVTDAIRQDERLQWFGVRHEEAGAFAAAAEAQLTGSLGVCMGTVGPGSIHLLNGLYDAKKSHAPVLAVCGQVPLAEIGSDYFQEVDNDALFRDVAVFSQTLMSPSQLPHLLEQAVNAACSERGVAVLTLPADVAQMDVPRHTAVPLFVSTPTTSGPPAADALAAAARLLDDAEAVTLLVGQGARASRPAVLALAEALQAPMVLTLKAKEGLERDNRFEVGQNGLLGNPAAAKAFDECDALLMLGTDFPYRDFYPDGKHVIQIDAAAAHIGRRTPVEVGIVADIEPALQALLPLLRSDRRSDHLEATRSAYLDWRRSQQKLTDPGFSDKAPGRLRSIVDNADDRIRPELVAASIDRHAADDAIFTADTGMSTVWAARFLTMRGTRRLIGSFNLGSMANAMPQALGAQALDRERQVVALCGDGGLTMLLGDLLTAVTYRLPVTFAVFNNRDLGMVKLEQEEAGLPESGTELANPDLAAVARAMGLLGLKVSEPSAVDDAVRAGLAHPGPVLLDVETNAGEIALPPNPSIGEAVGFAVGKLKEVVGSDRGGR